MIEELAARVFAARDAAHRAHWKTGSYAAHMALGGFYEAVIESVDDVIETYQGQFGLIGDFTVTSEPVPNITSYLTDEADWIAQNRAAISNGSDAVANLVDGLVGHYRTTVYKLTFLL